MTDSVLVVRGWAADDHGLTAVTVFTGNGYFDASGLPAESIGFAIRVSLGSGTYDLEVVARDSADNTVTRTLHVLASQAPPFVGTIAPVFVGSPAEPATVFVSEVATTGVTLSVEQAGSLVMPTTTLPLVSSPYPFGGQHIGAGPVVLPVPTDPADLDVVVTDSFGYTVRLPVRVHRGGPMAGVSVSYYHRCAVAASGTAWCWGKNDHGELGDGSTTSRTTPMPVVGTQSWRAIAASAGGGIGFTCALTMTGTPYCWGRLDPVGLASATPVAMPSSVNFDSLTVGALHICGLTASGSAYCWGDNTFGQLGDGTTTLRAAPVPVAGGLRFSQLSAGAVHTCGRTLPGAIYCWGSQGDGALGIGPPPLGVPTPLIPAPTLVSSALTFEAVSAGDQHTCGITTDGVAYCWGLAGFGRLGTGEIPTGFPQLVATNARFRQIAAGDQHTCGVSVDGRTYCWGDQNYSELGRPYGYGFSDMSLGFAPTPVEGAFGLRLAAVSVGGQGSCAISTTGALYCWGAGDYTGGPIVTPNRGALPAAARTSGSARVLTRHARLR